MKPSFLLTSILLEKVVLRVLGDIYFPRSIIIIEEDGVSKTLTVSNP